MKIEYMIAPENQPFPDLETSQEHISKLLDDNMQPDNSMVDIVFTGREVTEWNDFLLLCRYIKEKYTCTLEINTNAAPGVIWWSAAARALDTVTICGYHETLKKVKTRKLADYLFDLGINTTVNMFIDPAEFEKCIGIVDYLKDSQRNWVITVTPMLCNGVFSTDEKQNAYFDNPIKQPIEE